jgi:hypothetical protein
MTCPAFRLLFLNLVLSGFALAGVEPTVSYNPSTNKCEWSDGQGRDVVARPKKFTECGWEARVTEEKLNLSGMNLRGMEITRSAIPSANLSRTDLTGAVIENTSFEGVDLSGAKFKDASFKGAELNTKDPDPKAEQIALEDFRGASFDFYTIFPTDYPVYDLLTKGIATFIASPALPKGQAPQLMGDLAKHPELAKAIHAAFYALSEEQTVLDPSVQNIGRFFTQGNLYPFVLNNIRSVQVPQAETTSTVATAARGDLLKSLLGNNSVEAYNTLLQALKSNQTLGPQFQQEWPPLRSSGGVFTRQLRDFRILQLERAFFSKSWVEQVGTLIHESRHMLWETNEKPALIEGFRSLVEANSGLVLDLQNLAAAWNNGNFASRKAALTSVGKKIQAHASRMQAFERQFIDTDLSNSHIRCPAEHPVTELRGVLACDRNTTAAPNYLEHLFYENVYEKCAACSQAEKQIALMAFTFKTTLFNLNVQSSLARRPQIHQFVSDAELLP